jgi:hypothetical protein
MQGTEPKPRDFCEINYTRTFGYQILWRQLALITPGKITA